MNVHIVFFLRDPRGGGIGDSRMEMELDLPAVPRRGDLFDVHTFFAQKVRDVMWSWDGRVSIALEEFDTSVFGERADAVREELIRLGWLEHPVGKAKLGLWPTKADIDAAEKRIREQLGDDDEAGSP